MMKLLVFLPLFLPVQAFSSQYGQNCALVVPKRTKRLCQGPFKGSFARQRRLNSPRLPPQYHTDPIHHHYSQRSIPTASTTARFLVTRGGAQSVPPTLLHWIGPALSSAILMALYSIGIKLSSSSIHPILGGFVLQLVAVLLGSVSLGVSSRTTKLNFDSKGLLWSIFAGLAVGAAELVSFYVSSIGVPASQSIPVMIGGSVVFGSILGASLLKERMTPRGWLGVALVVAGIVCVATDPGANLGH